MQNKFPIPRFVTTREFAAATGRCAQTIRKNFCLQGECYGIRPQKVGGRLLWPVEELEKLLRGEAVK